MTFQPRFDFAASRPQAFPDAPEEALTLDLEGYEGPLHVLLELARRQKIDLLQISILALADQYLAFIHAQRVRRFELAGDYLVMASWLVELKSRLLLPQPARPEPEAQPADALAAALGLRLAKLDAMRGAADALKLRPRLGLEVFASGAQGTTASPSYPQEATVGANGDLYDLVAIYAEQRQRALDRSYEPRPRATIYALEAARARLSEMMPTLDDWTRLESVTPVPQGEASPSRASCLASTFAAGLEMVRDGRLQVRQSEPFDPLYLRRSSLVTAGERA